MDSTKDFKMVIVLDDALPLGLKCNTAAVLSLTLGNKITGLIDKDLKDGSGVVHRGLTNTPLPILKARESELKELRTAASGLGENLMIVDITDAAQTTKNYADYEEGLKSKKTDELQLLGIALAGFAKDVKSLTGNLGLMR